VLVHAGHRVRLASWIAAMSLLASALVSHSADAVQLAELRTAEGLPVLGAETATVNVAVLPPDMPEGDLTLKPIVSLPVTLR